VIRIGLAGWGDHADLYTGGSSSRDKLKTYGGHFPVVEVDSSFYAVQPARNAEKWVSETPDGFGFVFKAYQGMTGHLRGAHPTHPFESGEAMFQAFRESIRPVVDAGKMKAVLFQYPPWFDCTREHVNELREAKRLMEGLPVALEFRNRTWFTREMEAKTLSFMEREGWIHSVCDEPQAGIGSIPTVLKATDRRQTIVRFHGRNESGWNSDGRERQSWREVRYLYRYSERELLEWKERLERLQEESEEVIVIFNNNSGGDAAANAKQLMAMLGIGDEGLGPRQLDLF